MLERYSHFCSVKQGTVLIKVPNYAVGCFVKSENNQLINIVLLVDGCRFFDMPVDDYIRLLKARYDDTKHKEDKDIKYLSLWDRNFFSVRFPDFETCLEMKFECASECIIETSFFDKSFDEGFL